MAKNLPLTYEEVRTFVILYLAEVPGGQLNDLRSGIAKLIKDKLLIVPDHQGASGLIAHMHGQGAYLTDDDYARVGSIIWDLIIEGVIRPGLNDGANPNLPFFHVTPFGKEKIKDPNTPFDPDGYLKKLKTAIPTIDPIIVTYITESLHTFRINCLLSSTITLGCAAEKAILLAIAAYGDALPASKKAKFKKVTDGAMIKTQYEHFNKMLGSHLKALLPSDIKDGFDTALTTVFNMFRTHRNDAGHPTGKILSREEVHALLAAFPMYVKKVHDLIGWISANAPLP